MVLIKAKSFLVCISLSASLFLAYLKLIGDSIILKEIGRNIFSSCGSEIFSSEISNKSEKFLVTNTVNLPKILEVLRNPENPSPKALTPNAQQNKSKTSTKYENQIFFLKNFLKNDRIKNRSIFLNIEKRFFEDKCLTAYNESESNDVIYDKIPNFEFLKTKEGKEYKTILAYHSGPGIEKSFRFGFGHEPFEGACCKEKRCFMTQNRSMIPVEEFDAILFHFSGLEKKNLPTKRARHQRWVLFETEAPPFSSNNPQDFEGIFNWTQTYRKDSDIVAGYGAVYNKKEFPIDQDFSRFENPLSLQSAMKTKSKLVAWFVSHCKTDSKRELYVKRLRNYLPVDIYGKCGPLKCTGKMNHKCYLKVEREYKFYLSFENNLCREYVSEKFYNILNYYVVPVVRGGSDYVAIAPPHSYIDVKDFKTPKDLADYLIYLDGNDTAYMEYFNWKKDYIVLNKLEWLYVANSFCSLCQKLHNDTEEKIHYNLSKWFFEAAECNKDLGNF